ncbi:phage collar protein [Singulisphaera sp. PoT]|uniref:phage collar protein n=1 Tax=Singulisphaera sp. PoT TaxID=3411797 RepID=UPI003BF5D295
MSVPGSNLLAMATRLIAKQPFEYHAFRGRETNYIGQDVTVFAVPVTLLGSIQPVPRSVYQEYGLDFQRNYVNVYVSQDITDIARDVAGDRIVFQGRTYECISKTPWIGIDGWDAVLCVEVPVD